MSTSVQGEEAERRQLLIGLYIVQSITLMIILYYYMMDEWQTEHYQLTSLASVKHELIFFPFSAVDLFSFCTEFVEPEP